MNQFTNWLWKQFTRDLHPSYTPSPIASLYWLLSDLCWYGRSLALAGDDSLMVPAFPTRNTAQHHQNPVHYTDVLSNPHFVHLTALLRVSFRSYTWRREHPQVAFWALEKDFREAVQLLPTNKQDVVSRFVDLILAVTTADTSLHYSTADMVWLFETLDRADAKTVLSLFCACYSSPTGQHQA